MIAFTSDIDWAPDEVILDMLNIFESFNIKCTVFATHKSKILHESPKKLFELAIHPNFNFLLNGQGGSIDEILDAILTEYPDAKGIRSHSMTQSSLLLVKFAEKKLVYDANHFLPYHTNIQPFKLWTGMIRIPYVWEDYVHWAYDNSFDDCKIDLNSHGLKIFNFHPIHVFLNTENSKRYESAKKYYHNAKELVKYRNDKTKGTRDMLIQLLSFVKNNQSKSITLHEIANQYNYENQ